MEQVCKLENCYGCHACYNVCPKDAISMQEDQYGTVIPMIQQGKCVDCGMCQKVCPALNESKFVTPRQVYAAIARNESDYRASTSGGIATAFAKKVVENGGSVYGAAIMDDLTVRHTRAATDVELEAQRGSKYVQSAIGDSYQRVREDLKDEKQVMFVGTPCQVDGMLYFLGRDYKNLITVNLICHGVPANRLLKENVNHIVKEDSGLDLSFRTSTGFALSVYRGNETLYQREFYKDPYFLGFMRKLFYRNACYSCKYAQKQRVGDITIGDFWGFDKSRPFVSDTPYGLSVVLINTEAGDRFFQQCSDRLYYQERPLEEAVAGNPQLQHPSPRHRNYAKFRRDYLKYGFRNATMKSLWPDAMGYRLVFLKQKLVR